MPLAAPFAALLLALLPVPHPDSLSSSVVVVRGERVTVQLRFQTLSLLELTGPQTDADGDGLLGEGELDAVRADVARHLLAHYRLRTGSAGDPAGGAALEGRLASLQPGAVEPDLLGVTQWLEATLEFSHAAPLADLLLDISIFMETAPNHSDLCELRFNDQPAVEARFWLGETVRFYAPPVAAAGGDAAPAGG
ncbi:MAG: hypothetical protein FJ296_10345, partial [Planctomycetes bacterium]|nr:hypothetical protein [Planctomycetota bacterium]